MESYKKIMQYILDMIGFNEKSWESKEFASSFDLHDTGFNLEPKADVKHPPHLAWKRCCLRIKECDNIQQWVRETSTFNLRKSGAENVKLAQEEFLSARILRIVKLPTLEETMTKWTETFSDKLDYGFEEEVQKLVDACIVLGMYGEHPFVM